MLPEFKTLSSGMLEESKPNDTLVFAILVVVLAIVVVVVFVVLSEDFVVLELLYV